ncbi:MAG TPA: winged helix-turn-helix transcriptional regulator [Desulfobacteraceae bacterium]|nr:winged helix-turn-helix transcriptional regulator [Desulfobacteraceae bacterium]
MSYAHRLQKQDVLDLVDAGENSSLEFKLDTVRPEQLAKEIVGMANLHGGVILLGVSDESEILGISRQNLEEWVMDTVFGRFVHPVIIPHYQEIAFDKGKRVAAVTVTAGTAKPYVLRHKDREDIYVRIGSTTRLATREQALRLFGSGGLLHAETLPVSGTEMHSLDLARLQNYLSDILKDPEVPETESAWLERLDGLGFLTRDNLGQIVCTIAGLALFGVNPRRYMPQAGLRIMAFDKMDKDYKALLDTVLDGPMVGRWDVVQGKGQTLIDEGLVEKFVRTLEPFITEEADTVDKSFRREKRWIYPLEAVRETLLNALIHRDWTRPTDIEIARYADRLEIISPGALPNTMTIEKMKAGRRTPRNPVIMEVMRDYGYVDARGMGIRTKVIPLTRKFAGVDPVFEATDDFLRTAIPVGRVLENGSTSVRMSLEKGGKLDNVPEKSLEMPFQGQLLSLIKWNPQITYDELAAQTRRNRKTVQRHLQTLKKKGLLRRLGPAKGGQWEVVEP